MTSSAAVPNFGPERNLKSLIDPFPVLRRNLLTSKRSWFVFVSGIFEPLFYLFAMGSGLGRIVGDIDLAGTPVSFATFVAAGMMASSAMNGTLFEATFNLHLKLKIMRSFDALLNSPLRLADILFGEMAWAVARGSIYSTCFLAIAALLGSVDSWWALLSVPACALIALAFAALGFYITTFVRTWVDFDWMQLVLLPMFMCSTTFYPLDVYPVWFRPVVQATPLYNGVALIRDLNTGLVGIHDIGHVIYLIAMASLFGFLTTKRMRRMLIN